MTTQAELEAAAREWDRQSLLDRTYPTLTDAYKAGALFGAEQAAKVADRYPSPTLDEPNVFGAAKNIATAIRSLFKD